MDVHNQQHFNRLDEEFVRDARDGALDVDSLIRDTERKYKEEILEYADRIGPTDDEIFAQAFHR